MRYYGKYKGLNGSRPQLTKVETITAPIFVPDPTPFVAPLPSNVYVPPVDNGNKWYDVLADYLPKVIDFAKPLIQSNQNNGPIYQTPGIFSAPGNNQQNTVVDRNAKNDGTGEDKKKGLGDIISENPIATTIGVLGLGFLGFKFLK